MLFPRDPEKYSEGDTAAEYATLLRDAIEDIDEGRTAFIADRHDHPNRFLDFFLDQRARVVNGLVISNGYVDASSIAVERLTGLVAGDIMYATATGWVRLPVGTEGQELRLNATTGLPEWVTP